MHSESSGRRVVVAGSVNTARIIRCGPGRLVIYGDERFQVLMHAVASPQVCVEGAPRINIIPAGLVSGRLEDDAGLTVNIEVAQLHITDDGRKTPPRLVRNRITANGNRQKTLHT